MNTNEGNFQSKKIENKNDQVKKLDPLSDLARLLESLKLITGAEKLLLFKQHSDFYGLIWESEGSDSGKFNFHYPDLSAFERPRWNTLSLGSGTSKVHLAILNSKISLGGEFQKGVELMMSSAIEKFQESLTKTDVVPGSATFALLNEIKYWNLFNHLVQGIVYHDQSGQIIEANPAAEQILGLTKDQILGKTSIDPTWRSIHEDGSSFPGEEHPAMVALRTGKAVRNVIMGISSNKKSEITWIVIDAIPEFLEEGGKPKQVLVSFADITQVKEIKSKIRENRAMLDAILESTSESIWAIDLEEKLLYANTSFFDRFQLIHGQIPKQGIKLTDGFEGEYLDNWRAHFEKVFSGDSITVIEEYEVQGNKVNMETTLQPIFLEKSIIGASAFSKDVSTTVHHIQTIEDQNARLREIAWVQSHVIRAPLARLMGLMNVINSQEEYDSPDLHKLLNMLRKSAEELDSVIRDIVEKSEGLLTK